MKRFFTSGRSIAIIAAAFAGLFLFTLVLSALPELHERIHQTSSAHECAITLLTSGSCEHTPIAIISLAPSASPTAFVQTLGQFPLFSAHLDFSLLEHAPPSVS